MKPIHWTSHALHELAARDVSRAEAERTLTAPDRITAGRMPRLIYQRLYHDTLLGQSMLLRVVVEETALELTVVTLYKTSKLGKYL